MRSPKRGLSCKVVPFGKEWVEISSQSLHSIYINLMLQKVLFGNIYEKLKEEECIQCSQRRVCVIHISSASRLNEILTISGLCAVVFHRVNGYVHTCCGKVDTICNGKHMLGYIMDEKDGKWSVKLGNNSVVRLNKVVYNRDDGRYVFNMYYMQNTIYE